MSCSSGHSSPSVNPALLPELDSDADDDHDHDAAMQLDILGMWLERVREAIEGITHMTGY